MNESIKIQVALDVGSSAELVELARKVAGEIDWLEAGTPWILAEGMAAVRLLRKEFPDKFIVADMKIMDGGQVEAGMGFSSGADMVTVLGVASNATIQAALRVANEFHRYLLADLVQVDHILSRGRELSGMGVHYLGVHTASDDQAAGHSPINDLAALSGQIGLAPVTAAGGISQGNIRQIAAFNPAVIVVGSAITRALDPLAAAKALRIEVSK